MLRENKADVVIFAGILEAALLAAGGSETGWASQCRGRLST